MTILPFTWLVKHLRAIGGPTNEDTLLSRWGRLGLHARTVYDTIASSMPDFCLFPNLQSLDVEAFGASPGVLVMFAGPDLRSLRTGTSIDNVGAAECIEAFVDVATDTCPFAELHIANALALEEQDDEGSVDLECWTSGLSHVMTHVSHDGHMDTRGHTLRHHMFIVYMSTALSHATYIPVHI